MTRKLIIGCLQSIIDIYEMSKNEKPWANVPIDSEDVEAIRLSIEKWGEQNAEHCEDAINRQMVLDTLDTTDKFMDEDRTVENYKALLKECYEVLPSVTPKQKMGYCKECKYFEYDSVAKVDGIPLIVAHEICSKWGDGCKTKEDGYCFLFEPQESEDVSGSEKPNKWIPVSERLPDIHNYCMKYLVTDCHGHINTSLFTESGGKCWWSREDVIAWQPLPEPYKAESEDKNERI